MIKDNCKHIPLHLLNQMLDNNGQTSSGQEYDMTALQERANELSERNAEDLFAKYMAGLFAQADAMVKATKAIIAKAYETIKTNTSRFASFEVKSCSIQKIVRGVTFHYKGKIIGGMHYQSYKDPMLHENFSYVFNEDLKAVGFFKQFFLFFY